MKRLNLQGSVRQFCNTAQYHHFKLRHLCSNIVSQNWEEILQTAPGHNSKQVMILMINYKSLQQNSQKQSGHKYQRVDYTYYHSLTANIVMNNAVWTCLQWSAERWCYPHLLAIIRITMCFLTFYSALWSLSRKNGET